MFAVVAAFTLATATLVIPLVHQAQAARPPPPPQSTCHVTESGSDIGTCARGTHGPPT